MKTHLPNALKTLRLPLGVAISSCLLVACSGPRIHPTQPSTPISAPSQPASAWGNQTQSLPVNQPTAVAPIINGTPQQNSYQQNPYQNTPYQASPYSNDVVQGNPYADPSYQNNQYQPAQSLALIDEETLALLDDFLEARDMTMVEGDAIAVERYGNLWDRVRYGYKIQPMYHQRIEAQKQWFSGRQSYIERLTARASRYLYHTVAEAERRGIPTELALLPIIESSYDPSATSNAQAAGLWQFIPSTGRIYGLNQSTTYDGRRDVIESTRAAYDFLTSLYNQFGSWELALAAYNAGPGRVQRAIDANRAQGLPVDYWSLRLPTETMNYVPRFMAVTQIIGEPARYNINLPAIANHAHFRAVPTNRGVSLHEVSQITGVPVNELQLLNPALTNLRVDVVGPTRIVIPDSLSGSIDQQISRLAGLGGQVGDNVLTTRVDYVAPNEAVLVNTQSAQELGRNNTLPTTTASITELRTVTQEPPLSEEERIFIAEQIRVHTTEAVQAVNVKDGKIDLNAVQTAQSVLDAKGYKKTVQFDSNATLAGIGTVSGSQTVATNRPAVVDNATTYVVKRGDTLSEIAERYGVSEQQLRDWNQLGTDSKILAGSRLRIVAPTNVAPTKPASKPAITKRSEVYVVQSGDTLMGIADKHGLKLSQLTNYNNISVNAIIVPGQKLWLVAGKTTNNNATAPARASQSTYRVKAGDTLTEVAERFGTTKEAIAAANNMKPSDGLISGATIVIPTTKTKATPAKAVVAKTTTYTVKSGDTLTSVANRHNVSVDELASANKLNKTAGITIGQKLTIPATKGTAQNVATATTKETTGGQTIKKTESYKVKSGETLTSIANRYGVSVADLAKTNNLATNARLSVGQTIKVPKLTTTHKVKSGETLNGLAKRYGVSVDELAKMNGLKPSDRLQVNQTITVPAK